MNQRSDPSSISFGRLLRQTADTVHQQQAEIADLKRGQLSEQEKAQAKQLATERKQERLQRNLAKQLKHSKQTKNLRLWRGMKNQYTLNNLMLIDMDGSWNQSMNVPIKEEVVSARSLDKNTHGTELQQNPQEFKRRYQSS